jgi:hypothetical protein
VDKKKTHSLYQSCKHHHTINNQSLFFYFSEKSLSGAVDGATDSVLGADLADGNLETQIGVDVNHDLDLAAGLDTLDGELGNGLLDLPDDLTGLLFLVILGVEVGIILILSGLVLLGLGLGLGDLDITGTLAHTNQNVTTLLGGEVLGDAAGREGGLGAEEGLEGGLGLGGELHADGLGQVRSDGNHGVDGLLNVLVLELLDEGSLEGGTTSRKLGGVDGSGGRGRGEDGGGLGEDVADQAGELGGVGNTAREDDLVDVKDIELGLLDDLLDQTSELAEDLAGEELETGAVDSRTVVNAVNEGLNADLSVAAQAESLTGGLTLELELSKTASVLAGIGLVLLHELLGEVVDDDLVQGGTAELIVVSSGEDGVHATAGGNNGHIGTGATKVGNHNQLVGHSGFGAGIVGHNGGNGLVDELKNIKTSGLGGGNEGLALGIGEISGDSDDGSVDIFAEEVSGGPSQTLEVTGGDLGDGNGVGCLAGGVADGESDGRVLLLGVGRLVAGSRVNRLEFLADEVAEVGDGVGGVANELSLGLCAVVLLAFDIRKDGRNLTV